MMPPRCSSELHQTHLTEYPKRLQPRPSAWRWCPRLLKGRFRLTAPRGKGVVTCRNLEGWSAPAFFTFSDGLWLPRFGVTDMSLIVVVMGQNDRQLLSTKKIEIGTDVSAIGGPIGRHVAPENYDRLNREMLTYSISKGAFCSSVAGSCDDSRGQKIVSSHLWPSGRLPVPPAARSFLAVVD